MAELKPLRIFVSSPGDVAEERALAEGVLRRLGEQYRGSVRLEVVLWEHEPVFAHTGYQQQIVRPSECDLVICILWSKLGTRLPEGFAPASGQSAPTGTEYEIRDALEGHRVAGKPNLLIYRKSLAPQLNMTSAEARERMRQIEELDDFCRKTFYDQHGAIIVAHTSYADPREFERKLVEHVRRWLAVQLGQALPKAPRHRNVLAAGIILVAVTLAYFAADRLWLSRRVTTGQPTVAIPSVISDKSIAVLPFTDMSEKHDQEYFADGMAEEIIDLLVKVPGLKVPARTSSFYFKGKSTQIPEIARELGVGHVLEGSVRKSGDHLRVTAQLVRADNGYHLWSETYDRDLHDVFKVQDGIANSVVQALQITLLGGPLTRQRGGTQNLDAYELYLRGLNSEWQNTRQSLTTARDYFNRATKLDPTFGLAWAELSSTTILLTDNASLSPKEGYESARQLAQHALLLSPDLAQAHAMLQYIHRVYDWDWAASEAEGRRALASEPTNSSALMFTGQLSYTLGRCDDAERQLRSALVHDPLYTIAIWSLGTAQYCAGRFAEAEATFRSLLAWAPEFLWTRYSLGKTLLAEGKPEAALAMVQQERDEESRLIVLPIVLQAAGHKAEADDALKALVTKFGDTDSYYVAMTYAYRGEHDLALQWLERAYKQKDDFSEIVSEPLFKDLANDSRYKAFLRKLNLPE